MIQRGGKQNTMYDTLEDWCREVCESIPSFLIQMKGHERKGFYHYSFSGDIRKDEVWGLGNSVFAAKIYCMLGKLTHELTTDMTGFIRSFQKRDGHIYDEHIDRSPSIRRLSSYARRIKPRDFFHELMRREEETKRAETRQSFAALRCLGSRPDKPFLSIPYTRGEMTDYIHRLNWDEPWGAGSHINHLVFFLRQNECMFRVHEEDVEELIDHTFLVANTFRQEDGAWYKHDRNIPIYQKINGCMKMVLAFEAAERDEIGMENEMIDLCLSAINDEHACNNFNIICVLYYCQKRTDYRKDEIKEYCRKRLELFADFYWPEYGGFSFHRGRANDFYYGARVSEGRAEPDIHGTVLFLWGIVLISDILGFREELGLSFPIT